MMQVLDGHTFKFITGLYGFAIIMQEAIVNRLLSLKCVCGSSFICEACETDPIKSLVYTVSGQYPWRRVCFYVMCLPQLWPQSH